MQSIADELDVLNVTLGSSLRHETNLFRLPSNTNPQVSLGQPRLSDWITRSSASLSFNKAYGLQRFELQGTYTAYRYDTFDYLNFDGKDYRASWLWSLTPRFTGEFFFGQTESPVSYTDFRGRSLNIQRSQIQRVSADWKIRGAWYLTGGIDRTVFTNSAAFTQVGSTEMNTVEGGIKYAAPSGASLALVVRESDGRFLNRTLSAGSQFDSRYTQNDTSLRLHKWLTGKSLIDGSAGYLSRTHENFPQRDFSGPIYQLAYQWFATGKITLNANVGRNLFSFQEPTNSYFVTNYVNLIPAWQMTAKTSTRLTLGVDHRNYEGPIVPTPLLRRDTIYSAGLTFDWTVTRNFTLETSFRHDKRDSNRIGFDFNDNIAALSLQAHF